MGTKNLSQYTPKVIEINPCLDEHFKTWEAIFGIRDSIDVVAFQDGHVRL